MLEYLRNAAEKPLAKILIGILAFSFVGWGVAEWIFGNVMGDNTLVRVGGEKITIQQFNQTRSGELAKLSKEQQRAVYTDAATGDAFNANVLSTLTTQQMVESRANDMGFIVSDNRIAREIREFPEFQFNGQFSTYLFDNVLARSGYSEADFAKILRGQILRSMVLGSMSVPVNIPQFVLTASYNARYGMRKINYSTVRFSDFKVGNPTDEQLREFYAQNPQMIPETRSVSYILVSAKMDKPDTYDAALKTAQKIEDDVIAGESFADAAARHGAKFVKLNAFSAEKRPVDKIMTDAMVARVFGMDEGVESELVETPNGFVMVRVDKIAPAHAADFASVKSRLVADWRRAQQRTQAYIRANEILSDFNKDGRMAGGKTVNVSRTSGAPADVLVAAFAGKIGSATIVPAADAFYVMAINENITPTQDTAKATALRKELQNTSMRQIMDDYNSFLIRTYPVKINQKLMNKFFAK